MRERRWRGGERRGYESVGEKERWKRGQGAVVRVRGYEKERERDSDIEGVTEGWREIQRWGCRGGKGERAREGREGERDRERETERDAYVYVHLKLCVCACVRACVCVYQPNICSGADLSHHFYIYYAC